VAHQGRRGRAADCMFNIGALIEQGLGVAAPDYPAAADWYRQAAEAGDGDAAANLRILYRPRLGLSYSARHSTLYASHSTLYALIS